MADGGLGGVLGGSISETRDASLLGGSRDGLAGCRTWLRIGVRLWMNRGYTAVYC